MFVSQKSNLEMLVCLKIILIFVGRGIWKQLLAVFLVMFVLT